MNKRVRLVRSNLKVAKAAWGGLSKMRLHELRALTGKYSLCVGLGDVQLLDERWYVTHAGLLRLAERRHCAGIRVQQVREFCDPGTGRWVFKATIYKDSSSKGFVGYGDADPSNTSPLVRGAEMRVAETRAVNRALRKAYGIGICSVEELKWLSGAPESNEHHRPQNASHNPNGSNNGQPRLRECDFGFTVAAANSKRWPEYSWMCLVFSEACRQASQLVNHNVAGGTELNR